MLYGRLVHVGKKLLTDLHILDCELQEKAVNRREEARTRAEEEEAVGKVFVQALPPST